MIDGLEVVRRRIEVDPSTPTREIEEILAAARARHIEQLSAILDNGSITSRVFVPLDDEAAKILDAMNGSNNSEKTERIIRKYSELPLTLL